MAVFSRKPRLTRAPAAPDRQQARARTPSPARLTLTVAGSTLVAAAVLAAIWPVAASAQPSRADRQVAAAAAANAAVTSQTVAQVAVRFETAARLDTVRIAAERARHEAELLAAQRLASRQAAAGRASASATPAPAPVVAAATGSPQQIATAMLGSFGWSSDQFSCLDALWNAESGWNTYASNPGSGAYGIPQALPGSKMATAGADWQTDPATQIRWGLGYIQASYGSPCGAWGHEQAYGWY